jgi:hypothetical protein
MRDFLYDVRAGVRQFCRIRAAVGFAHAPADEF